jgi:hypothetical protein
LLQDRRTQISKFSKLRNPYPHRFITLSLLLRPSTQPLLKSLRGSSDRNQGIKALHLVTAWAGEQKLVLGQVKVEDKSNEIPAIPALLELLDLQGAIITLDAMGTQTAIINHIQAKKADYVVALKANHPTLYTQVKNLRGGQAS